jgi:hypothetical protein
VALHRTLGSYLRDALQEGGATAVACLPSPMAWAFVPVIFSSLLVDSTTFVAINESTYMHSRILLHSYAAIGAVNYTTMVHHGRTVGWVAAFCYDLCPLPPNDLIEDGFVRLKSCPPLARATHEA